MKLKTVTISGVDASNPIHELLALSQDFPFVEWGVLLSHAAGAHPKYPEHEWVESLCHFARANGMALSGHVCGSWTQQLLSGAWPQPMERFSFDRLQLNIAKVPAESIQPERWMPLLPKGCETIIQFNHLKPRFDPVLLVNTLESAGHVASVLLDASGGRGVESKAWPAPLDIGKVGYAGGLNPQNIRAQLEQLMAVTADSPHTLWIDMESGVRTEDGLHLDLARVRQCLETAAHLVR